MTKNQSLFIISNNEKAIFKIASHSAKSKLNFKKMRELLPNAERCLNVSLAEEHGQIKVLESDGFSITLKISI